MTDDMFERDLRAFLGARDPGPAPSNLAVDVRVLLGGQGARLARWSAVPKLISGVAVAAVLVLAIGVALAVRPGMVGPGAAPAPDPTGPYVMQPGDGVVTGEHVPLFQALAGLVAGTVLLLVAVRTTDRRTRIGASLGVLTLILVATSIGPPNALAFTGGGYGVTPSRAAPEDEPGMYVAVTGNQPFTLVLTVGNTSRLPVDLLGLAPPDAGRGTSSERAHLPRFAAIANLPQTALNGTYATRFERITIEPGDFANVAILGLAGTCSIPAPGPEGQGGYSIESVDLVYEQLTITRTQAFQLPEPVVITTDIPCPS